MTKIKSPTHSQVLELIETAEGEMKLAIMLGSLCGMRLGEIFGLPCKNVSVENKCITIDCAF